MSAESEAGLHVVDSSGWLEYLADADNADFFAGTIEKPEFLIVPTLSILEVFRWVLRERNESEALQAAALMQQGLVADLDVAISLRAAGIGLRYSLPLADSVILATAQAYEATLWTQDADFEGLPGVRYRPRPHA
jgi:predicted nucleic acid-binding protein